MMEELSKLELEIPEESQPGQGRSIFMDLYAMGARWHMARYAPPSGSWRPSPPRTTNTAALTRTPRSGLK